MNLEEFIYVQIDTKINLIREILCFYEGEGCLSTYLKERLKNLDFQKERINQIKINK